MSEFKVGDAPRRLLRRLLEAAPTETWWCGTRGCAMGHAAQMPAFRRVGLRVEAHTNRDGEETISIVLRRRESCNESYSAAAMLFGLSIDEAFDLFHTITDARGNDHRTPADVAREIRAFVARERKER